MPIAMLAHPPALTVEKELSAMYLQNKYQRWYYAIIHNAQSREATPILLEKHHIIPKSLGGNDDASNIVNLTPKEHFICHLLLTKMCEGESKQKMVYACWAMANLTNKFQARYKVNSKVYEKLRESFVVRISKHFSLIRKGKPSPRKGVKLSQETKDKISAANRGKNAWNKGVPRPDHVKEAVSKANKGRVAWNKGLKNFKNL